MAKKNKLTEQDKEDIKFGGVMRLVEGIILQILDNVSISGKWYPKDIGMDTLMSKKALLKEMNAWLKDWHWDVWVSIYCWHYGYNKRTIKKNFENIRRQSVKYVNKRIKDKKASLNNLTT